LRTLVNRLDPVPELLDHLAETKQLEGALVTIDAMGCQVAIAPGRSGPDQPQHSVHEQPIVSGLCRLSCLE
jgi:predicted transposase YbfD/YdcC